MFCPVHKIERDGAIITSLQLFLTTYNLISQVSEDGKNFNKKIKKKILFTFNIFFLVELLATDSTFKLVWNGNKLLLVGSCDHEKKFHPFGVALTMTETRF